MKTRSISRTNPSRANSHTSALRSTVSDEGSGAPGPPNVRFRPTASGTWPETKDAHRESENGLCVVSSNWHFGLLRPSSSYEAEVKLQNPGTIGPAPADRGLYVDRVQQPPRITVKATV
jgi:hypothetical protein